MEIPLIKTVALVCNSFRECTNFVFTPETVCEECKVELTHLHDIIFDITGNDLSVEQLVDKFLELPEKVKQIAFNWGGNDTVFRDEAFEFIQNNKILFLK